MSMPEPAPTASAANGQAVPPAAASDGLIRALRALLVASALIPLATLAGLAWQSRQEVLRNAEGTVGEATDILREHGLRILDSEDLMLELVALHTAGLSWSEIERSPKVKAFLQELADARDHVVALWLIDAGGRIRAASTSSSRPPDVSSLDFVAAHREANTGTFVGRAYADRTLPTFFTISRRRPSTGGEFDGVIAVAVNVEYFEKFFASVSHDVAHGARLVRADGEILARAPPARNLPPLPPHDPLMQRMAAADAGLFWAAPGGENAERLYGFRRLGAYPVEIVFSLDAATVLRPWYRTVALYGGMGATVSTALLVLTLIALRQARYQRAAVASLRMESMRRAAMEEALHHSQKLEAMGRLTGGVAHDFNNLLTTVIGSLDLLGERHIDARARQLVSAALQAAERGARLTEQLLAFARKQQLKFEPIDLNRLIAEMSEMLSRTIGPLIEIEPALEPQLWPVRSDANQIELAVLNVAGNARDAMPLGGKLRVETANIGASDLARPPQLAPGDYVLLAIADTGAGMSEEVKARAFEPFFTTKEVGKGSGLGLSQVYGIAAQSGGSATIDSRPEFGTTIRIYLPRASAPPAADVLATSPEDAPLAAPGGAAILLVEDDRQVREFARTCLEEAGYRVVEAAHGRRALELLEHEQIDLLVADFAMPGMNGAELAARVRARRPGLPVLLITGYMNEAGGEELSGMAILRKPFRATQLVKRVRALLATL